MNHIERMQEACCERIDMHVHTSETSPCGKVSGKETADLYQAAGYQTIMITDHYHKEYFESLGSLSWDEKIDRYLEGFHAAKKEGERISLQVLLGMEFRNFESDNDFLIVGVTEAFLRSNPELYRLKLQDAVRLFHKNDMLVIQAHPVRFVIMDRKDGAIAESGTSEEMISLRRKKEKMPVISLEAWRETKRRKSEAEIQTPFVLQVCSLCCENLLDGIEVYNGNSEWAQMPEEIDRILYKHPTYIQTSSSDFHKRHHLARGGMVLSTEVRNIEELKAALRNGAVSALVKDGVLCSKKGEQIRKV